MKKETEVKETVTAAAAKAEPAAKKTTARKTATKAAAEPKKAAAPRRKAAAKAVEAVYVQYDAGEWDVAALVEQAKAAYVAAGHEASEAKKVTVYIKPQEGKAYYVVNDVDTGSVEL